MNKVILQEWAIKGFNRTYFKDGGYSLHLTKEDLEKFIKKTATYQRIPWKKSIFCLVDSKTYGQILTSRPGLTTSIDPETLLPYYFGKT